MSRAAEVQGVGNIERLAPFFSRNAVLKIEDRQPESPGERAGEFVILAIVLAREVQGHRRVDGRLEEDQPDASAPANLRKLRQRRPAGDNPAAGKRPRPRRPQAQNIEPQADQKQREGFFRAFPVVDPRNTIQGGTERGFDMVPDGLTRTRGCQVAARLLFVEGAQRSTEAVCIGAVAPHRGCHLAAKSRVGQQPLRAASNPGVGEVLIVQLHQQHIRLDLRTEDQVHGVPQHLLVTHADG